MRGLLRCLGCSGVVKYFGGLSLVREAVRLACLFYCPLNQPKKIDQRRK